ncbi:TIGR03667 family PPOX class F420-dependent oxidoreductase [Candidatus Mycolicibacterium alkanivorans]|uniref:TIGR03667 family PPOX class F420-dependent oxidoreductase n=1 Tax=Candidatus Mycolicibacterium alkanivorans TaxID=2954114 RepID=A0ABS9YV24_9MYCO|nr:TIGR03667 family PPOX class F420-dependent oxidoreductase [Candidatus Mycolicibacterium alkanivorans]MCI4675087.1 TIGR03667 family PPOX class F420-dependent oxidoreductase [Candidatus Mycolicibacterium alkanivorans]
MNSADDELDFRGVGGHLTETSFAAADLTHEITRKLKRDRYAWLTTVAPTGIPAPMLVWFSFDGTYVTVYTRPHASRVTHVFQHPEVSVHLESDGFGGGIVIIGGKAAVTAENVDPRDDNGFWSKYHMEAEAIGLSAAIASYSVRITVTPTTLRTTFPG